MSHNPFDNLESAYHYLTLLREAVTEAEREIGEDVASLDNGDARRLKALQLVTYKLQRLDQHLKSSRLIVNDLRTLRKLLLDERGRGLERTDHRETNAA